ncbi:CHASE2 domain-containing protein [Pusillimonas minor]|uniref:CHASE2 domain-containing protein n=1 Tax=Pusillimonas minor TaxID=2697024 RepID=A0A842HMW3_9BURK|nr:CHASE2 domain-containing protein [Pusillimonas minor]
MLLIMGFAHLTLNFSPLGLSDRADKYLQDLFNTYAGDLVYGSPQDDITVLLLTDETLEAHQRGHWPASYDFHGKVLNSLLHEKPRAVFIDFLWLSQRLDASLGMPRDGDYLIKVLRRYNLAGIPVFLASTPAVEQNWPELAGLVVPVPAELSIDVMDFVSRTYPVVVGNAQQTPAFRIAQEVRPDLFATDPTEPMDVFWGTLPNKKNDWMKVEKHDADIATVALYGFSGVKTPVPFVTTLYVRDLLKQTGENHEDVRKQAAALMKDKIILYGANLTGVNDLIFTPTRDILPGVYLHAMALDNLLRWGGEYKSAMGTGLHANRIWHGVWSLLIVLPVAMLLAFFHRRPGSGTPGNQGVRTLNLPSSMAPQPQTSQVFGLNALRSWRMRMLALFDQHRVLGRLCVMLALVCWFAAWGVVEFVYFNISAGTVAGYLAFLTLGFFLDKIGLVDWMIDHVYLWIRKACSRLAQTLGRYKSRV